MNTLVELINTMEVREEDESFQNAIDIVFERLEKGKPLLDENEQQVFDENGEKLYTNGKQKVYEDRTKAAKKAEMDAKKNALRAEDIAKGVFVPVSALPKKEPKIAVQKSADLPMAANQ